ncbi:hypothetical protein ANN_14090 [Periplaneta americana]|uniref:Uncharacterized protein n=1 Tax=Periplaneta americana TaxID=6978 RepID=A0ABQ8SWP9_PERAM|nr:hypothetical protein ANN_14090 [Periplaneta americana]
MLKRTAELVTPDSAMQDHIKLDLQVKCWRPMKVKELTDSDLDRRVDAYVVMLQQFPTMAQEAKTMF